MPRTVADREDESPSRQTVRISEYVGRRILSQSSISSWLSAVLVAIERSSVIYQFILCAGPGPGRRAPCGVRLRLLCLSLPQYNQWALLGAGVIGHIVGSFPRKD